MANPSQGFLAHHKDHFPGVGAEFPLFHANWAIGHAANPETKSQPMLLLEILVQVVDAHGLNWAHEKQFRHTAPLALVSFELTCPGDCYCFRLSGGGAWQHLACFTESGYAI